MTQKERDALKIFSEWYANLPTYRATGGPARGAIGAALVALERLKEKYDLNLDSHRTAAGKSQIIGLSGVAVARILKAHGETRPFLTEGGRTNRGAAGAVSSMLDALKRTDLQKLDSSARIKILDALQAYLIERVREYHGRQRLKIVYDPTQTARQSIHDFLALAQVEGKEGPVAQYLVGAKLQIRFPGLQVENKSYSTADEQSDRPGDFLIGDTAFHVTVSPMPGLYEKCKRNIQSGFRVYLLVPERIVVGTRQNAESAAPGKIAVESIESFVAPNIEELATFSKSELVHSFKRLMETYNERVSAVENDKSLLIEIPRNLS